MESRKSGEDVELKKSNVLLIGPTGSGKTLLAQTLAQMLNVPFCIADATNLTEAGYVGEDVENIIVNLLQAADHDVERAQRGIIYIDEIDKISRKSDNASITGTLVAGGFNRLFSKLLRGPLRACHLRAVESILNKSSCRLIQRTSYSFAAGHLVVSKPLWKNVHPSQQWALVQTFSVKKRDAGELLALVQPEDLVQYGLIPEFIGRLPVSVTLDELKEDALVRILTEPKNALIKQYKRLLHIDGVQLKFTPEALKAIARLALAQKAGARGLRSILENAMLDIMYEIPSEESVREVIVNEEVLVRKESLLFSFRRKIRALRQTLTCRACGDSTAMLHLDMPNPCSLLGS